MRLTPGRPLAAKARTTNGARRPHLSFWLSPISQVPAATAVRQVEGKYFGSKPPSAVQVQLT